MVNNMEVLNDILGYKNRKIYQDDNYFSFSIDSILLCNFISIKNNDKNIIDLGCGNGIMPLTLSLKTNNNIIGIEIQKKLYDLAIKSVKYNKLENQIQIINDDIKNYVSKNTINKYDIVLCNPPYFKYNKNSIINKNIEKVIARHEVKITLNDIISVSKKLLNNGGKFYIVYSCDRFCELISLLVDNNIKVKRIQFVYEKIDKDAIIVLVEGVLNGNDGLKIEKPFVLYNNDGTNTSEYDKLLSEV